MGVRDGVCARLPAHPKASTGVSFLVSLTNRVEMQQHNVRLAVPLDAMSLQPTPEPRRQLSNALTSAPCPQTAGVCGRIHGATLVNTTQWVSFARKMLMALTLKVAS